MNGNRRNNREEENTNSGSWWAAAGMFAAAAAAVGTVAYLMTRRPEEAAETQESEDEDENDLPNLEYNYELSHITNRMQGLYNPLRRGVETPSKDTIYDLDTLIHQIYKHYVALNADEYEHHYAVFLNVFLQLHKAMKEVDKYYERYASKVEITGSHSDRVRIKKPDEFDVDVVIRLPLCKNENPINPTDSDYEFKAVSHGHIQLRLGVQGQKIPERDWQINKTVFEWIDNTSNYNLTCSKFSSWFRKVVVKALNKFKSNPLSPWAYFTVNGIQYKVRYKTDSGPAVTLQIINEEQRLSVDFDLVPALSFPEKRWPVSPNCRSIPEKWSASEKQWLVVPKPDKNAMYDQDLSWRIGMYGQEKKIIHNLYHMKQALRLMKKLRDSLGFDHIASYYIKTLFLWEIEKRDAYFWSRNSPVFLFEHMTIQLKEALEVARIPYFWNSQFNLIGNLDEGHFRGYARKLGKVITAIEDKDLKAVAKYLLTDNEFYEIEKRIKIITRI